jgi:hypothetical protein
MIRIESRKGSPDREGEAEERVEEIKFSHPCIQSHQHKTDGLKDSCQRKLWILRFCRKPMV